MNSLKESGQFWAVRIEGSVRPGFALNGHGGRALFGTKREAKVFCKELQEHMSSKCSVVPVDVTIRQTTVKGSAAVTARRPA